MEQGAEGVSGHLFIDLLYLCLRSETRARGLRVPILFFSGLLQFRAPQGTFKMKFMVSQAGTLNELGNVKHKHTHKKSLFWLGIRRTFTEIFNMDDKIATIEVKNAKKK